MGRWRRSRRRGRATARRTLPHPSAAPSGWPDGPSPAWRAPHLPWQGEGRLHRAIGSLPPAWPHGVFGPADARRTPRPRGRSRAMSGGVRRIGRAAWSCAAGAAWLATAGAQAQTTTAATPEAAPTPVGAVVVTAQRRLQDDLDAPLAITTGS